MLQPSWNAARATVVISEVVVGHLFAILQLGFIKSQTSGATVFRFL
jgi:hypothetical protein